MQDKGLLHIYCGDGKGKTTAAIGLAIRACGAGMKVCFAQFMKSGSSSEWQILNKENNIETMIAKNEFGFTWKMTEDEKAKLRDINTRTLEAIVAEKTKYEVLILDEIISAYQHNLVDKNLLLQLLEARKNLEIVLTGRNPAEELLEQADYITEMKSIRHPYEKGIQARKGIEF